MIYLSLPLLHNNFAFNNAFQNFILKFPDKLIFPLQVESVYGAFPYSLWNGGINSSFGKDLLYRELTKCIDQENAVIRLDCSNTYLINTDLFDRHQNVILSLLESRGNMIDIADLSIYNYIEDNYKNFSYTLSENANLIHPLDETLINGFLDNEKFAMITLNNLNAIDLKNIDKKSKIEMLVSNNCCKCSNYLNCKSKEQNNQIIFSSRSVFQDCPQRQNFYNTKFLIDEIKQYSLLGIHHFKIAPPNINEINQFNKYIIFNLVKPEAIEFCLSFIENYIKEKGNN